jgi:hypothetical protein
MASSAETAREWARLDSDDDDMAMDARDGITTAKTAASTSTIADASTTNGRASAARASTGL